MTRFLALVLAMAAGPLWAQDQIVIPDDETQFVQPGPRPGDTELTMVRVEVQNQKQLRGRYGPAWAPSEVEQEAARACASGGLQLVYFRPGNVDGEGRTEFAAVCQ